MRTRAKTNGGFTLIEIIVTLLIVAVLGALAGLGLTQISEAFLQTKEATAMAQKAQLALPRFQRAVGQMTDLTDAQNDELTLKRKAGQNEVSERFWVSNGVLYLNNDPLADNVAGLSLSYRKSDGAAWTATAPLSTLAFVEISLTLNGPESTRTFSTKVNPRNTYVPTGILAVDGSVSPGQGTLGVNCFISAAAFPLDISPAGLLYFSSLALLVLGAILAVHARKKTFGLRWGAKKGYVLLALILTMLAVSALGAGLATMVSTTETGMVEAAFEPKAYYLAEAGQHYAAYRYFKAPADQREQVIAEMHNQGAYTLGSNGSFSLVFTPYWLKAGPNATYPAGSLHVTSITNEFPEALTDSGSNQGRVWASGDDASVAFTPQYSAPNLYLNLAEPVTTDATGDLYLAARTVGNQRLTHEVDLAVGTQAVSYFPPMRGVVLIRVSSTEAYAAVYEKADYDNGRLVNVAALPGQEAFPDNAAEAALIPAGTDVILRKFVKMESTGAFATARHTITYSQPLELITGYTRQVFTDKFDTAASMNNWKNVLGAGEYASGPETGDNGAMKVASTQQTSFFQLNDDTTDGALGSSQEFISGLDWMKQGFQGPDLQQIYLNSNHTLSYDLQIKVKFTATEDVTGATSPNHPASYMPGLAFRVNAPTTANRVTYFGLSFMRGAVGVTSSQDDDSIPDTLFEDPGSNSGAANPADYSQYSCLTSRPDWHWDTWNAAPPRDGRPYVVLWTRDVEYVTGGCSPDHWEYYAEWLAWHPLCLETGTTLYYYEAETIGSTPYPRGWYLGQIPGSVQGTRPTKAAVKLVDKSGALARTVKEGVTILGYSAVEDGQVDSTHIGAVRDPATGLPVPPDAQGRPVGFVFPGQGETSPQTADFRRINNYRLYLKEWVTLMVRLYDILGDFDCDGGEDDHVNIVQAWFADPDGNGGGNDNPKDAVRQAVVRGQIKWPEDGDYLTTAIWPVPDYAGYTVDGYSSKTSNRFGGCSLPIKHVERGNDGDYNSTTHTYDGDWVYAVTDWFKTDSFSGAASNLEIGLHSFGVKASGTPKDTLYFDDFGMVVYEKNTQGLIKGLGE
ncbi:MAG: type II secretion system protein [Thermodesulfobacteriota bacterium]